MDSFHLTLILLAFFVTISQISSETVFGSDGSSRAGVIPALSSRLNKRSKVFSGSVYYSVERI